MRRFGSCALVLLLAGTAVVGPATAPAAADNTGIAVQATLDRMDPAHPVKLDLRASSPKGITDVRVKLRHLKRDAEPYAVVEDFTRYEGDDKNGKWRATYPADIEARPGLTLVEVEADVADGTVKNGWFSSFNACYATTLTDVSVQPDVIDIDDRDISVRGRAMFQRSRDHAPEPVAHTPAYLQGLRDSAVHTDENGWFQYRATVSPWNNTVHPYVEAGVDAPSCAASVGTTLKTTPQETEISARLVEPTGRINVGDPVVIEGRVLRKAASGKAPADITVQAGIGTSPGGSDYIHLAEAATNADGTFRLQAPAPQAGSVLVRALPTPFLTESRASAGDIDVIHPTKITEFSARKESGGRVRLEGILHRQETTGLAPLRDRRVSIEFSTDGKKWSKELDAQTGHFGHFVGISQTPFDGYWRARYVGGGAELPTRSPAQYVQVYTPTRFSVFNAAPEPVGKGSTVTAKGRLLESGATGERPLPNAPVSLLFSTDGDVWYRAGKGRTGRDGWVTLSATAKKDGRWRMVYNADSDHRAAYSPADYVDVRLRTSVTSFNAAPEPVRRGAMLTVSGRLNRYDASWAPIAGERTLTVYFRAAGTTKWTKAGTVTTGKKGWFSKRFKATRSGSWRVSYTGNTAYLPTLSTIDQVDVR
ncbi:hypothetical protein SAMN04489712_12514 [Thermomonospora echinospora]|uniref:Uncharacterized protein n=1 Tax=Thermomonospora echinospora TaxID=1992 RepID=A0A1H6DZ25_9ACTN|nr:hypothetical protein [Thermomonospora echinospora]SEG90016.1 hypothetical protein SAMN04489712_12514 [Thermomonospora echinospora]